MTDDAMFSRSGRTGPGGKLTSRLDVPVSTELEEAVIAMATLAGKPKAEFVRGLLERAVFGDLAMLRRLAGTGPQGRWEESPSNGGNA